MSQDALFSSDVCTGDRHRKMLEEAIEQATRDGYIGAIDAGAISIARANAMALDQAEADRKYYAVAQLSGPYMELLEKLKMIPSARDESDDDAITQALAELGTAAIRNP